MSEQQVQSNEIERLTTKSVEAFILGLEIYNKPTLRYRIEGFSYFIVNAWELMLKAELIKRGISIYQPKDLERTISALSAVSKVYTDKNTRIRLNLEKIIELRNLSTHYITEDYELKYAPLFQASVLNFINELYKFHNITITDFLANSFLMLSATYEPLSNEQIKLKYPTEIAEKLIKHANEIEILTEAYQSDKFAIPIRQNLYITKKKADSDFTVSIVKESKSKVAIVKELKDPADTHKYTFQTLIKVVHETMKKRSIRLGYENGFNSYVLGLFIEFYDVKSNLKYSYKHIIGNNSHFTYSQQLIDFIIHEIEKNPSEFVNSLKKT